MTRLRRHAPGLAVLLSLAAGCAHRPPPQPAAGSAAPRLGSDEEFTRLRADYDLLDPGIPERVARRARLSSWLLDEARREQAAERPDQAWEALQKALSLWDPDELKGAPRDESLAGLAADLERFYRRRGGHREVLALLGVQITLRPEDAAARARFSAVASWVRGEGAERCDDPACDRLIDELEEAASRWSAPFLVEQLAALYRARQASAGSLEDGLGKSSTLADLFRHRSVQRAGYDLARLYLRAAAPDRAMAALAGLAGQIGDQPGLREALERAQSPSAQPADVVALAELLTHDGNDRALGVRICRDGARRFPGAAEPLLCVGALAQAEQVPLAIDAFTRALRLQPERRESWESLALLHQIHLQQLVGDERTDQLEAELVRVEALHGEARKRFPGDPLRTSLAGSLFEVGRGFYQAGRVEVAARYLRSSLATAPTVYAQEQLATIELKREHPAEAAALFRAALEHPEPAQGERELSFWEGRLARGLADALAEQGRSREAGEARRRSLAAWDRFLVQRLEPDETADAELERGKVLYELGERERGLAALQRAIDAAPERSYTYANVLAFLVPRGEVGEALDAYHRALGRAVVSEYIKIYASLWILDLDRRLRLPEDLLARDFLDSVRGAKWHHDLARWASGHQSDAELLRRADTAAKRCELDFYQAMRSFVGGQFPAARAEWRKVLGSGMMSFFEFDMAGYYLRHEAELQGPLPAARLSAPPAR